MSFTVYHTKNGVQRPIKISILDAFRGVPDPKRRKPKVCSCCGKSHHSNDSTDLKKQNDANANANQPKSEEVKKNDDALTEDDQIMIRMKAENASRPWQEIVDATSFTDVGLAKARWKEIEHKKDQPAATDKEPDKNESKKSKKDKKKQQDAGQSQRINKDREDGLKRQAELKAAAAANATGSEVDQAAANVDDKDKAVESTTVTTTATTTTNDLKDQADKYDRKKWQAMASKHYDKTGTRITATQAQKLAEGN